MKFIVAVIALAGIASAVTAPRTAGQDICCAANLDRAKEGLKPYKWTPELDYIATKHSEYMLSVDKISHDEKPGTSTYQLGDRMKTVSFEFSTAGENVANGFEDLWATEKAWMESPGHRANIMSTSFTVCGGGVADPGRFFTTDFASPLDVDDDSKYYTLKCSNGVSSGAYTSDPNAHAAMMGESSVTPLSELGKDPVPSAAKSESSAESKPSPEEFVATTSPAQEETSAETSPVVEEVSSETAPVVEETSVEAAPAPAPVPAPAPTTPTAGKCKRVPKGSIAAGKCKPCKKCSANSSPFHR